MAQQEPARPMEGATPSPENLFSAAEEQAHTLKAQLMASADAAAEKLVGETKAEGKRRIEAASRRAKALSETVEAIERAEKELVQRTRIFKETSKALRADLDEFMQMLLEAERQLQTPDKVSELRLVEVKPQAEEPAPDSDPELAPAQTAEPEPQPVLAAEPAPKQEPAGQGSAPEQELAPEPELEVLVDTETELEPVAHEAEEAEEEDDDEPPTPEQIRRFFGEPDPAEEPRPAPSGRKRDRFYDQTRDDERTVWSRLSPSIAAEHLGRRDKIAAELGGVLIGLGGTFALIRFVLLG